MKNKNKIYFLVIVGLVIFGGFWSQQKIKDDKSNYQNIFVKSANQLTDLQKQIVVRFRDGNIGGLAEFFDEEISITIMKESDFYTKEDAENILLDFCQNHKPKKFFVQHHGMNSDKDNYFLIGKLITTADEEFRVFISNSPTQIETIDITIPLNL